jgi:hypothetical protein
VASNALPSTAGVRKSAPRQGKIRVLRGENVTIAYSATKMVKPEGENDVWYFCLANYLKQTFSGKLSSELD